MDAGIDVGSTQIGPTVKENVPAHLRVRSRSVGAEQCVTYRTLVYSFTEGTEPRAITSLQVHLLWHPFSESIRE